MKISLSAIQKRIVEAPEGNMIVAAGAGTGKTRVLVERFLYLVTTGRALVGEILALTFTDKAASEMKERIRSRFQEMGLKDAVRDLESAHISTLHAFASRLLKDHPLEAGIDPDCRILEAEEADALEEKAMDEVLESYAQSGTPLFELLRKYGEDEIRTGMVKCLRAARTDGVTLADFFLQSETLAQARPAQDPPARVGELIRALGETGAAAQWADLVREAEGFEKMRAVRAWVQPFSRRGGKSDRAGWQELRALVQEYLMGLAERLLAPYRSAFEEISRLFESRYEALKAEQGALDFDDLQVKLLELFQKDAVANRLLKKRYQTQFKYIMVDEFQDTNPLQIKIIDCLAGGKRLFLVGDYKQSIYGFRGTSPDHFLEREKRYEEDEASFRVSLIENFRTRETLLAFVNRFFREIWSEDGQAPEDLIAQSGPAAPAAAGPSVEVLETEKAEGESMDRARMREAETLAAHIAGLHDAGTAYGDMAVLFQAMTSSGIYENALKQAGIPYFVVAGRGFYHQPEVRDLITFLACLDNPLADIPLAGTLRSPLFRITDDTLYRLARYAKKEDDNRPLYHALAAADSISEIAPEQAGRIAGFRGLLAHFIARKDKLRLAELLEDVLEKTGYELHALAHPQGVRRYANLRKLVDLAREHEAHAVMPLGDFIRAVRKLETRQIRESEAQVEAEKSRRVVRLMTIHQAKGLEFPVVFVADLGYRKQSRESKTFLAEAGAGYGMQLMDPEGEKAETVSWQELDERIRVRERREWKRLFYVAATRAKYRLVLSGVYKPVKNPKEKFSEMSTWMDWVKALEDALPENSLHRSPRKMLPKKAAAAPAEKKKFQEILAEPDRQNLEMRFEQIEEKTRRSVRQILDGLEARVPVTARVLDLPVSAYSCFQTDPGRYWRIYELGQKDRETGELTEREAPPADEEERMAANDFGTAVHGVLERIDIRRPEAKLKERIEDAFYGWPLPDRKAAEEILRDFIKTDLFGRIRSARRVLRELPFILNLRHGRIHGVIDLLMEEAPGQWTVVDYKTAVGDAGRVKASGYGLQIETYALALEELTAQKASEGVVYFLKNHWHETRRFKPGDLAGCRKYLEGLQLEMISERSRRLQGAGAAGAVPSGKETF